MILAVTASGCTPAHIWWLARGDGKVDAEHQLVAKEGRKEIKVAILATASPTIGVDFTGVDRELASMLGRRLVAETKDSKKPIEVIEQSEMDRFLRDNPNWKIISSGVIGEKLGADYLIDLNIDSISMFQQQYGREAYAGQANIRVAVYDTDEPDSPWREYVLNGWAPVKDVGMTSAAQYRQFLLERLALDLAWKHVKHPSQLELRPLK